MGTFLEGSTWGRVGVNDSAFQSNFNNVRPELRTGKGQGQNFLSKMSRVLLANKNSLTKLSPIYITTSKR